MQPLTTAFLALYLAHLTTDFVFQSRRLVEGNSRRKESSGFWWFTWARFGVPDTCSAF